VIRGKMEKLRRGKEIRRKQEQTRRATIHLCGQQRQSASVEARTTGKSHHGDARGRGFPRRKWPEIMSRE
jgi:hypothetical protein